MPHQPVTRIVCTSVSTVRGSVMQELFAIRDRISAQGAGTPVMGALLYSAGWFVLWLEGPAEAVEAARRRAASASHNIHQQVIHRSVGRPTLGTLASVAMSQLGESASHYWHRIEQLKPHAHRMEPLDLWRVLSMPSKVSRGLPALEAVLLSAEDNSALHILNSYAQRSGGKVGYLRYSDSANLGVDVGVAYADIATDTAPLRLQVVSRRALRQQLVQACITKATCIVVLGGRSEATDEIAAQVRAIAQTCDDPPGIYRLQPSQLEERLREHIAGTSPAPLCMA